MKKFNYKNLFLILLPIMAVGLATTVDSVTVFDSAAGTTEYYSYFDLIPDSNLAIIMPLAALLSVAAGILAAIYVVKKPAWGLKAIYGTSFCATTLAVVPVLLRGDVIIVPNVALPIFMGINCLLAAYMRKKPEQQEEVKGKRLSGK